MATIREFSGFNFIRNLARLFVKTRTTLTKAPGVIDLRKRLRLPNKSTSKIIIITKLRNVLSAENGNNLAANEMSDWFYA